jgi:Amt family ammonium transporter
LLTFLILKFLSLFMTLRLPDDVLETGDLAVHDEEAYPVDTLVRTDATRHPSAPPRIAATAAPRTQPTSPNPTPSS